ncbi:adenylyl-sulfate kinase [Clostridium sp.]|uniref:adenylyl-sulfate kinase n=1 Tax=Clostridium sp. TaxID=1506 RepID=UPI002FCBC14F
MENIITHDFKIGRKHREKLLSQKSKIIWLTGLSGSGKSTIANELEIGLINKGYLTYILDGDSVRSGLNSDLKFSLQDRHENIRRVSEILNMLLNTGIIVIATFVSPVISDRETLKERFKEDFIEVFIDCTVSECEKRDPKGLYSRARNGEIKNFTGIDSPYEKPINPSLIIDTTKLNIDESVEKIMDYLNRVGDGIEG